MTATLSDHQAEKARLQAAEARREYQEALSATVSAEHLHQASRAVRDVILAALAELPARFAEAIGDERDETRVHYLLSDAVHALLDRLGQQAATASAALPAFGERFRRGARPRDLLTVSQWADRHRWLTSGTNAPGQWRTALTPYLRDIQDDLSEHSPVRTVVFCKSAGVGGTEGMFNWIGYTMHHLGNKDMMVVVPTLELRDRSFNPRLSKMLDECPVLADLVSRATRSSANRVDILEYGAHARVIKAGANSPDSLRSDHLPNVICDEVDAYKWDVGGEGDPMTLIENRQRTFSRAKTFLISTPTNEGESRIDQAYQRSDRRRYHLPCPHCGEKHPLAMGNFKYRTEAGEQITAGDPHKTVTEAWFVCPECGAEIREGEKPAMLAAGEWIPERPHITRTRGYHINAFYAPIGLGLGWVQVAQKWVGAQADTTTLKAFVNTYLGEVYREEGDSVDATGIMARVENYDRESLEKARKLLRVVAWCDVQKDRLEATVYGFGAGEEAWALRHLIIEGDTALPPVWSELDRELRAQRVSRAGVDAGYNTTMVMAFCKSRRWVTPTKGIAGRGRPLVEDERKRRQRLRRRRTSGQQSEPLGVDQGKALIYARLRLPKPGPGYIHYPAHEDFDDEFFLQLAAEELRTRMRAGRPFAEWVQIRPRNEALDCAVGALAICRLAGPLPDAPAPDAELPPAEEAPPEGAEAPAEPEPAEAQPPFNALAALLAARRQRNADRVRR